ncbi:MAG: RNA polymerase sigma factor [Planctomycetota bacterium]|jgi:RNA polymerase sigma factor (sigma-70 family)
MDWVTTTQVLEDLKESNDILAWTSFRNHFYSVIFNFAKTLGLSATDAEDATQETMLVFLKAFRDGKYDREKGQFSHWLFGVARRVILNFRKRLPRKHFIVDNTTGTSFWDMVTDKNAVRNTWDTEWRYMVLERCLWQARREFDQKVFNAFELYALSQKPVDEVCRILGMLCREMLCTLQKVASCQNCVSCKKILRDLARILSYELS